MTIRLRLVTYIQVVTMYVVQIVYPTFSVAIQDFYFHTIWDLAVNSFNTEREEPIPCKGMSGEGMSGEGMGGEW